MPPSVRITTGRLYYHAVNRAIDGHRLFHSDVEYAAFLSLVRQAKQRWPTRLFAFCLLPNHWHLVLAPIRDGDLSRVMKWLAITHTQRYRRATKSVGRGHLYQGRYKSRRILGDGHFVTVCRYVERNALDAGLVHRAEEWPWCSLWNRLNLPPGGGLLDEWLIERPATWTEHVNATGESRNELE
jgi:putative transposase